MAPMKMTVRNLIGPMWLRFALPPCPRNSMPMTSAKVMRQMTTYSGFTGSFFTRAMSMGIPPRTAPTNSMMVANV